jgi:hypothetical protein
VFSTGRRDRKWGRVFGDDDSGNFKVVEPKGKTTALNPAVLQGVLADQH